MEKKIILIDVDDVVTDFMTNWLAFYNQEFNDNIKKEDIDDWNITNFIKPEAHQRIYEYIYEGDVFTTAEPTGNSIKSLKEIMSWNICRIVYVTAGDSNDAKYNWLTERGLLNTRDNFVACHDKSLIRGFSILDDKYSNVNNFLGKGYLFDQPWNQKFLYPDRIFTWDEYVEKIRKELDEANILD